MDPMTLAYIFGGKALLGGIRGIKGKGKFANAIFGMSQAEEFDENRRAFLDQLANIERQTLADVGRETTANVAQSTADAKRRAIALGREGETESFILPMAGQAMELGERRKTEVRRGFDQAKIGAEMGRFNVPSSPSLSEYAEAAVPAYLEGEQTDATLKALERIMGGGAIPGVGISELDLKSSPIFTKPVNDDDILAYK